MTDAGSPRSTRRALLRSGVLAAGTVTLASGRTTGTETESPSPSRWRHQFDDVVHVGNTAYRDGTLYVPDDETLYGVDVETGTREKIASGMPFRRLQAAGDLLLNAAGRRLDAVDPAAGRIRWTFEPEVSGATVRRVWAVDERVVVAVRDGPFLGFDRATGEQVWQYGEWTGSGQLQSPHGAAGDGIFVLTDLRDGPAVAVDPADGSIRWRNDSLSVFEFVDGTLYGYSDEFDLAAVDVDTGDLEWTRTYPCGSRFVHVLDGVRYTRCGQGFVRLDDDHEVVWHHDAGERGPLYPLGVDDGAVFVLQDVFEAPHGEGYTSNVVALDVESGDTRWTFEPDLEHRVNKLDASEVGAAYEDGVISYAAGKYVRLLDTAGEVRERHEVDFSGLGTVGYPPSASAVSRGSLLLTGVDRVLAAFDTPDWEPSNDAAVGAPGFGLGVAGLGLAGGAAWLARRRNQS